MTHSLINATTLCAKLTAYWNSLPKTHRGIPSRIDINPTDIQDLLPDVFLLEKTQNGATFRVTGGRFTTLNNCLMMRGQSMDTAFDVQSHFQLRSGLTRLWQEPSTISLSLKTHHHTGKGILLPLVSDAGQPDRAIGLIAMNGGQAPLSITSMLVTPLDEEKPGEVTPFIPKDLTERTKPTKHPHLRVVT